mgnify:CR=1 FL=1
MTETELRNRAMTIIDRMVPKQGKSESGNPLYSALWNKYVAPANGTSCGRLPQYLIQELLSAFGLKAPNTGRWIGNGGVDIEYLLTGMIDHRPDAFVKPGAGLPKPGDLYHIQGGGANHIGIVISADHSSWITADSGAEIKGQKPAAQRRQRQYLGGALSGESQQGVRMVPLKGWADIGKYFRAEAGDSLLTTLIRLYGN